MATHPQTMEDAHLVNTYRGDSIFVTARSYGPMGIDAAFTRAAELETRVPTPEEAREVLLARIATTPDSRLDTAFRHGATGMIAAPNGDPSKQPVMMEIGQDGKVHGKRLEHGAEGKFRFVQTMEARSSTQRHWGADM